MNWFQMWVTHKDNTIEIMKRCDFMLQKFTCVPHAPDGIPVQGEDGTIEVRGYSETGFPMAKRYLQDQGFVIEREKEHSPKDED